MKKTFTLMILVSLTATGPAHTSGLVASGTARDSLAIPFVLLDSSGNTTDLATGDSIYIVVFRPGGQIAFKDSLAADDSRIITCPWEDFDGGQVYALSEKVSVLAGADPPAGVYGHVLTVDDNTGADLTSSWRGYFQVVNTPLECSLDSAAYARKAYDSLVGLHDSLATIIDSLESQSQWVGNIRDSVDALTEAAIESILEYDTAGITAGFGAMLKDTAAYQGAMGAFDSTTVARWVWNTPQANHGLSGTFGRYLDAEISGLGVGSGLFRRHLIVYDSALDQTVSGVRVAVRTLDQTALIAVGATDSQGMVTFNLDNDTLIALAYAPGYIFETAESLLVDGPGLDTVRGYRFDPGAPGAPFLCRVYGYLYDINGEPESDAEISARLPAGVTVSGIAIISPFSVTSTTDSLGYFCLDLIPSSYLEPATTEYEITIMKTDGTILRENISVPEQPTWRLQWQGKY